MEVLPMDEHNGKDTGPDLFGLNSIGKIQADIEKDLEKTLAAAPKEAGFLLPDEAAEMQNRSGRILRPDLNSPGFVLQSDGAGELPASEAGASFAAGKLAGDVRPSVSLVQRAVDGSGDGTNAMPTSAMSDLGFEQPSITPTAAEFTQPLGIAHDTAAASGQSSETSSFALPEETIHAEKMESFYRETIKEPQEAKAAPFFNSWRKVVAFVLIFTIGTGSLGFGAGFGWGFFGSRDADAANGGYAYLPDNATITTTHYVFEAAVGDPAAGSLADIVEILEPSVVTVTAYFGSRFRDQSLGSGIIFAENDERIFIVTNDYVVRQSERVAVSISGSEPLEARPVGSDSSAELNVISVDKVQLLEAGITSVVIATFGNSDEMRVGDTVLAIGNAMGEGNSVTRGVISAPEMPVILLGRETPLMMLQTDAAINHGNSGGPLINARGEVIGININRASDLIFGVDMVEGMGYSISSNVAMPILNNLINYRRPGLGIMGGSVDEEVAMRFNIPILGVYVSSVIAGQAAYNAGIQASDIITSFNGLPVFYWDQLVEAIRECQIGDVVEIRVLRDGRDVVVLTVTIGMFVQESF